MRMACMDEMREILPDDAKGGLNDFTKWSVAYLAVHGEDFSNHVDSACPLVNFGGGKITGPG